MKSVTCPEPGSNAQGLRVWSCDPEGSLLAGYMHHNSAVPPLLRGMSRLGQLGHWGQKASSVSAAVSPCLYLWSSCCNGAEGWTGEALQRVQEERDVQAPFASQTPRLPHPPKSPGTSLADPLARVISSHCQEAALIRRRQLQGQEMGDARETRSLN